MLTIDIEELKEAVDKGLVAVQKHPTLDLFIYNYTAKVQYERLWSDITLACRGLILDAEYNIVARPFPKFFNLGEQVNQVVPEMQFEVYDKMDGSLGIMYWHDDKPYIATRGSFNSEQAKKANAMLYDKYSATFEKLDKTRTYLFEIIYPENRIVVDYGLAEELVLLAMINTQTGEEYELEQLGFPIVARYNGIKDLATIKDINDDCKEGFVIRFANNHRLKIKFKEYIRLHRIVTQISSLDIWEYMQSEKSFEEILDSVPDEFYQWVKRTRTALVSQYDAIDAIAKKRVRNFRKQEGNCIVFFELHLPCCAIRNAEQKGLQ